MALYRIVGGNNSKLLGLEFVLPDNYAFTKEDVDEKISELKGEYYESISMVALLPMYVRVQYSSFIIQIRKVKVL